MRLKPLFNPTIGPSATKALGRLADALEMDWHSLARPSQLPPEGDWRIWLLLAGRGFGKTRSGAEFVKAEVEAGRAKRIALVAPTAADARDVLVEGESGILAISPSWNRPNYEPSRRRVTWPSGATAITYSADEPDRLRGPQHDLAWCDELAAWRYPDAWDNLMLGLRIGTARCVVTTTPKPTKLLRDLLKREGAAVAVTRGRTEENRANLAAAFFEVVSRYAGTRLGRQELDAELLEDVPNALWNRDQIERARVTATPQLSRVVVAIDPAGGSGETNDETGIVVCGCDGQGHGYVLDDLSGRYQPDAWARRAIGAYRHHQADRIVAETNFGGSMVEATLRAVDPSVAFKAVTASRGKALRAEPVAALYEQGRVHHIGCFAALEDQMAGFASDFNRASAGFSPDRVDALVFALSELMIGESASGWIEYYKRQAEIGEGKRKPLYIPDAVLAKGVKAVMDYCLPGQRDCEEAQRSRPAISVEQINGIDWADAVTMRGSPHGNWYIPGPDGRSAKYTADEHGIIHDVAQIHVEGLKRVGCSCV